MLIHTPTKTTYPDRKSAKIAMGHTNFNKAVKDGEFIFITPREKDDIVI